jgi:hypothetical protein
MHDNARPHTANKTNETLRNFKWEVLEHHLYGPNLAPSSIHLFGPLKHHLSAEHFPDDEAVEREVTEVFFKSVWLFVSVSICNLLIDLPLYYICYEIPKDLPIVFFP